MTRYKISFDDSMNIGLLFIRQRRIRIWAENKSMAVVYHTFEMATIFRQLARAVVVLDQHAFLDELCGRQV